MRESVMMIAYAPNPIGDAGVTALAQNPRITELNVEDCGVGDEGAAALANSTTITKLEVGANRHITAAGYAALSASPNPAIRSLSF